MQTLSLSLELYLHWYIVSLCTLYRLDCGTGPGVVKTSAQVHLNAWNHVSVYRHDWGVLVQLNGGKREEGRSQVSRVKVLVWFGNSSFFPKRTRNSRNHETYIMIPLLHTVATK